MSADRRVALLLLEFKTVRGELEQSKRAIQTIEMLYEDLGQEARNTDRILAASGNRLSQLAQITRGQTVPAVDELRDSLREAAAANERLNEEGGRGGRAQLSGLSRLGRLGGIPGAERLAGVFTIPEDISQAAAALGSLSPVALAAAGGIAVVGAGLLALEFSLRDTKTALDTATASNQFYFSEARRLTTEQNQERLASIQRTLTDQRDELANIEQAYQRQLDAAQAAAEGTTSGFADVELALARLTTADDQLAARADELRTSIGQLEGQEQALNRAVEDGTAIRVDAAAAERALADARQANFDRQIANEIRILSSIPASTQALEQRLAAINREQEVLTDYIDTAGLSEEATSQLEQRLIDLGTEESLLAISLAPLVSELEAAAEAAKIAADKEKMLADDRKRAAAEAAKLGDQVTKLETEIGDIRIRSAEKLAAVEQDRLDKIADAERDRNTAIAEARRDAKEARIEAEIKANAEEIKAEFEHERNLKRIHDQFNRDSTRAIEDRDAVALARAQEARDQGLADEQNDHKTRLKEVDRQLKEQNRQIDKRLAEQTRTAVNRYTEQLRVANEAARKAVQLEQARARKEIQDRQASIQILLQQQMAYHNAALGLAKQGAQNLLATEKYMWQQRNAMATAAAGKSLATGPVNPGAIGGSRPKPPPKFAGGGVITKSGMAVVHAGEVIMNRQQQRGGGVNIPITVNGSNKQQIMREVWQKLDKALDEVA